MRAKLYSELWTACTLSESRLREIRQEWQDKLPQPVLEVLDEVIRTLGTAYEVVAKDPKALRFAVENWTVPQLVELLPYAFLHHKDLSWLDIAERIVDLDPTGEALLKAFEKLYRHLESVAGHERVVHVPWLSNKDHQKNMHFYRRLANIYLRNYQNTLKHRKQLQESSGREEQQHLEREE